MPGILIDCLRKYQRLSQTPLESTRAPVHFLMLGGAGQAVPTIDAYEKKNDCSSAEYMYDGVCAPDLSWSSKQLVRWL